MPSPFFLRRQTSQIMAPLLPVNVQTGTTYTVSVNDHGRYVTLNNAAAIAVTVPQGLGREFCTTLIQLGAGQVTASGATGVTINAYGSAKTPGQYGTLSILAIGIDNFIATNNLLNRNLQVPNGPLYQESA